MIRVNGAITITPKGTEITVQSNKTIVGVGTSGQIVGGGFFLGTGVRNVIIRNLTIRDTLMADDDPDDKVYDYDGIQMDTADHIWIDHNLITRMNDGLIDSRKDTTLPDRVLERAGRQQQGVRHRLDRRTSPPG